MSNGKGIVIHLIIGLIKKSFMCLKDTSCKQRIKNE